MIMIKILFIVATFYVAESFLVVEPRHVVKQLTVNNGAEWGDWTGGQFCVKGAYAAGYSMKIEGNQGSSDDTSLNAIALHCEIKDSSNFGGDVTSGTGVWGSWGQPTMCSSHNTVPPIQTFLKSFILQVESHQGPFVDDTGANYVKFKCRDIQDETQPFEIAAHPGHGLWGSFGGWSESCDHGSAICGLNTRIEPPTDDDSALNDVIFYCCDD